MLFVPCLYIYHRRPGTFANNVTIDLHRMENPLDWINSLEYLAVCIVWKAIRHYKRKSKGGGVHEHENW